MVTQRSPLTSVYKSKNTYFTCTCNPIDLSLHTAFYTLFLHATVLQMYTYMYVVHYTAIVLTLHMNMYMYIHVDVHVHVCTMYYVVMY